MNHLTDGQRDGVVLSSEEVTAVPYHQDKTYFCHTPPA
jgi:hypothetical protein